MRSLPLGLILGLLSPCLMVADRTDADYDPAVDFTKLKTFQLRPGTIRTNKSVLNNDLVRKRMEAAIRAELSAKGLTEASAQADVAVQWTLGPADRREVQRAIAARRGWRSRAGALHYTEGTLVIDLRDADSQELIYRVTYVDGESDAGKLSRKIEKDVARALEDFPPKPE